MSSRREGRPPADLVANGRRYGSRVIRRGGLDRSRSAFEKSRPGKGDRLWGRSVMSASRVLVLLNVGFFVDVHCESEPILHPSAGMSAPYRHPPPPGYQARSHDSIDLA